jgi:hypothetical protein
VIRRLAALGLALLLSACGGRLPPARDFGAPTSLSCVPYARATSGIQLDGDAWQWWEEADGRYPRGHRPRRGAVLVFAARAGMKQGHLAVVSQVQDARTILVTQANWLPDRIEHNQPVIDVSNDNDWTEVRVWYEPADAMGVRIYRTDGFIYGR